MKRSHRTVLDTVAQQHIPDDLNLLPQIIEKLEKKTLKQSLRTRPALVFLLLLLALSILSGVAYAVGRSLGYIPGVGIVDQDSPLRVLAEPVSMEREGIILTVTDAVLSSDKTTVLYTLENVPWEALSHQEGEPGCYQTPFIHLPNGEMLLVTGGGGGMGQMRMEYPPIPSDINQATFMLPCIMDTVPGAVTENWALDLQFQPAPPDMTVVPVVEIPSATDIPAETIDQNDTTSEAIPVNASEIPFTITTAMSVDDQTILLGTNLQPEAWLQNFHLTDVNGEEVYTTQPTLEGLPPHHHGFQFQSNQAYPLTISFESVSSALIPNSQAELEFDVGENPQPDQEWVLNQSIEIGGRTIVLETIQVDSRGGYEFNFTGDPDVTGVSVQITGYTALGGGGSSAYGFGYFSASKAYETLPTGQLHVIFSNLEISTLETWEMQWSPENPPDAAPLYGITLQVDQYIPLEDGYYVIGHIEWTNQRIHQSMSEAERMRAFDAAGQEVAFEKVTFAETMALVNHLDETQWIYHLYGKDFNGPLRLELGSVYLMMIEPAIEFTFDLSSLGFAFDDEHLNLPYKIGFQPLDIPELSASAFNITYIQEENLHGFEIGIMGDSRLKSLIFEFPSEVDAQGNYMYATGDSYLDEENNLLRSKILTDSPMSFPLTLIARNATVSGNWSTEWTPPTP